MNQSMFPVHVPAQQDAEVYLGPHKNRLTSALKRAMTEYNRYPDAKAVHNAQAFAMVLNLHVRRSITEEYSFDPDVSFHDKGFFKIGFGGLYRARVKKVKANKRPKNRASMQQYAWDFQSPTLFPEMEGVNLTLSYQVDSIGQNIVCADLTCWVGQQAMWSINVFDDLERSLPLFPSGALAPVPAQDFVVETRDDAPRQFVVRPNRKTG